MMLHMHRPHSGEPKALTKQKELLLYQELQKGIRGVRIPETCALQVLRPA